MLGQVQSGEQAKRVEVFNRRPRSGESNFQHFDTSRPARVQYRDAIEWVDQAEEAQESIGLAKLCQGEIGYASLH